jgi:hypothetical protein
MVEASKRDAYQSGYDHIDQMTFPDAWKAAIELDAGLPSEPPKDFPEEARRAILGLARKVAQLDHEWS